MFPQGLQNVVTNTRCLFNGVTGLKRLSVHSIEEPAYDYGYNVAIELINTGIEEVNIDFSQRKGKLTLYITRCELLKKVLIHCEGAVKLSDVLTLLLNKNSSNSLDIRVVCRSLLVDNSDLSKFKHNNSVQKMLIGASVSIEASAVVWEDYGSDSPRNSDTEVGFSKLPESLRGIIVRRGR